MMACKFESLIEKVLDSKVILEARFRGFHQKTYTSFSGSQDLVVILRPTLEPYIQDLRENQRHVTEFV